MKQFLAGAAFGAAGILVVGAAVAAADSEALRPFDLFGDAVERVTSNYVRPIGLPEIVDKALHGLLSNLDAHSAYMNPEEFRRLTVAGAPAAVGLELTVFDWLPTVIAPIEGGPADKAGIRSGDRIAAIDGNTTERMPLDTVITLMGGAEGSKITLTILRGGQKPFDLTLTRLHVANSVVRFERKGDVGYIRLTGFDSGTDGKLAAAVDALKKQIGPGLKGYVLDLRDNPGGLLDQGVAVSDAFLESGTIVTLHGRTPQDDMKYDAHPGDVADGKPVVVLINEGSAAASEIVAAALKDHTRAAIVGARSFGAGTIQSIIPLSHNGGYMRLTTATFVRPSGGAIDRHGVDPDIAVRRDGKTGPDPQLAAALAQFTAK